MMKKTIYSLLLVFCWASNANAGEWTGFRTIDLIDILGASQSTNIIPVGNQWGAAGCPTAAYVTLTSNQASYKEMLALIITAKAADLKIRFHGNCGAHPFFTATKVRMQ